MANSIEKMDEALRSAVIVSQADRVRELLQQGANPNITLLQQDMGLINRFRNTPLIVWTASRSYEITRLLLEAGANPNASVRGYTALTRAIQKGRFDIATLLLAYGADPNAGRELPEALTSPPNIPEKVDFLIAHGADPDVVVDGRNMLIYAIQGGDIRMVRRFLYQDVNYTGKYGDFPLFVAIRPYSNIEILDLLYAHGARGINKPITRGITPLMKATAGNVDNVQWLLEHGADPNIVGRLTSPLYTAVDGENASIVCLLLQWGANPNTPITVFERPSMPLEHAIHHEDFATVKLLLDAGATIDVKALEHYFPTPERASFMKMVKIVGMTYPTLLSHLDRL